MITLAGLALIVSALGAVACSSAESSSSNSNDAEKSEIQEEARVINVEVSTISPSSFTDYIQIVGNVEALHDVTVSAEEGGILAKFYVEKGSRVEKGQLIAKLKDDVLVAQIDEAQATATLAQEQFSRQQTLWVDEKNRYQYNGDVNAQKHPGHRPVQTPGRNKENNGQKENI